MIPNNIYVCILIAFIAYWYREDYFEWVIRVIFYARVRAAHIFLCSSKEICKRKDAARHALCLEQRQLIYVHTYCLRFHRQARCARFS